MNTKPVRHVVRKVAAVAVIAGAVVVAVPMAASAGIQGSGHAAQIASGVGTGGTGHAAPAAIVGGGGTRSVISVDGVNGGGKN